MGFAPGEVMGVVNGDYYRPILLILDPLPSIPRNTDIMLSLAIANGIHAHRTQKTSTHVQRTMMLESLFQPLSIFLALTDVAKRSRCLKQR